MNRRGFIGALTGMITWPLWGKKKDIREELLCNGFGPSFFGIVKNPEMDMTYDPDIEPMMRRHFLGEMIREARDNYVITHGNYPNNVYLGKVEYDIWTKDHPEVFGHSEPICSEHDWSRYHRDYATAYGMLVYVKTSKEYQDVMIMDKKDRDWPEWTSCVEPSHLSVAYCSQDDGRGICEHVLRTVGYKVST